jgi:DNA polymerase I
VWSWGVLKTVFWLLDVNYEVREQKPEVWLWGIDDKGQRVLIIDRSFLSYFYLVVKEDSNPQKIIQNIESRKASEFPSVVRLETVKRRYFGKPVSAVKVVCQDPEVVTKYAKAMAKIEGVKESLEDDIRYSMRYLIDNGMSPCGWHEIEVEQTKNTIEAQVDKVYTAKPFPKSVEKAEVPQLRVLGFSTLASSHKGAPKPEKNPVVIVSVATNTGEERQFGAEDSDDKAVLNAFVKYVRNFDPDIIVGYGTNRQDWLYLTARAKLLGVNLYVDRANTEPHMSVYGHVSITGRANVDFYDFADELPEVKVKTLENIADFLNVMPLEKRTLIEEVDYAAYWEDPKNRSTLLKFSKENAQSALGVAEAMLSFAMQLSSLVGLPLDHVGTAAVGFRVEWYLMREAYKIGELIPKRVERPYFPYVGAIVLAPKPGLHENIAVLDFKAMYPSIMITQNVSPDTYVPMSEPEPPGGVNVAPEVKHRFQREPPGFYKQVLSSLIAHRDQIRPKLIRLDPKSPEYRVLDARQKAVKVITNAAYGYTGWIGARWYIKPVAEAATAWGRHITMNTIELAKKVGLEVVYSDTDSVFVKNEPSKIQKISAEVEKTLGLEIKPDEIYTRILFTEAKKKYCGLLPDGRLDIVGLEVVRGDWAACAKNVQEKVLEIIMKKQAPKEAAEFVRQFILGLRQKKVPYKDLIIWKTLTKKVEEYEVKAPHVEAAKKLLKEGYELSMGDKIGYVITVGAGKLYEKAKPYVLASYDEVDTEYYVTNQVLPAASRILTMFGITEDKLLPSAEAKPKTLTEFSKN